MKHAFRLSFCLLLAALMVALCACGKDSQTPPTTAVTTPKDTGPATVDMRNTEDYEAILQYIEAHPDEIVLYDISLGQASYAPDTTALTFTADQTPYDDLLSNLKYLPQVATLDLPETSLTAGQLDTLKQMYPNITVTYTVALGDGVLTADTTTLDLSWLTPDQVIPTAGKLALLPQLQEVQLMTAAGTSALSLTDLKTLQDACPEVLFLYSFELFGKTVSTADETIEYVNVEIGDEREDEIRQALDVLTRCTYFKLDRCDVSTPVMAGLREDYPDKMIVWRIYLDHFNMLTDEKILRLTHRLNDNNVGDLIYFTECTHLDIGHNEKLSDISFVQYMTKLECVILAGAPVSDISYFANCPNLVWLELCYCYPLKDLSPLADHPTLKYLNVSFTQVRDLTPLENVPLERFNCLGNKIPQADQDMINAWHPESMNVFTGKQPFGYGWRYNDHGYTYFEYYANMRILFRYDDASYYGNH